MAKFDGFIWSEFGDVNKIDADYEITALKFNNLGDLFAVGYFRDNICRIPYIAKYSNAAAHSYPYLYGTVFLDANLNLTKDTAELYKANVKVQLSNGNYTFTNANGYYQIQADSIGAYTLTHYTTSRLQRFASNGFLQLYKLGYYYYKKYCLAANCCYG